MEPIVAEEWRPVKGYEDKYEVSNLGRVKSIARTVKCGTRNLKLKERILKPALDGYGYYFVGLWSEGKTQLIKVHKLVAIAFLPPCPGKLSTYKGGWTIDHINEVKTDNRAENLQWLTRNENTSKGNRPGKKETVKGMKHGRRKLNEKQVLEIRDDKRKNSIIAKEYNVDYNTVWRIKKRLLWSHL